MPRSFAGCAVLAGYVLSGFEREKNYLAAAEGWLMTTCYLLRLAEGVRVYKRLWEPSIDLCVEAWQTAAVALTEEAIERPHWVEGDALTDGDIYQWRMMLLIGHLAATALSFRARGQRYEREGELVMRIERELKADDAFFWSEGTSPLVFAAAVLFWARGQEAEAVRLCILGIQVITGPNGSREGLGLPDPYYDFPMLLDPLKHLVHRQTFRGRSFTLQAFVEFLARRNWKRHLRALWYDISKVDRSEYRPDDALDLYLWESHTGANDTRTWPQPQEWAALVEQATTHQSPKTLLAEEYRYLLMPFLVAYPHRFNAGLAALVENTVS